VLAEAERRAGEDVRRPVQAVDGPGGVTGDAQQLTALAAGLGAEAVGTTVPDKHDIVPIPAGG